MPESNSDQSQTTNMLSFAPTPIFTGTWDHRPSVSSPLSSSPIRASSPLSPANSNSLSQRQVQSSPIQPPKFKFASRPSKPNPVLRKREDAHESRRKSFLQNVRQKSDDKAWQRRDIEGQFLKNSWLADMGRLSHDAPAFSEADIEDAMAIQQDQLQDIPEDDVMADETRLLDDDLEAMVASYEEQQNEAGQRPPSPSLSDEEYDDIFAELASQEQAQMRLSQPQSSAEHMDMT